jgi:phosphonate transport system substrate-binding protein
MITPKEGYIYYQQLGRYIEQRLQRPVQLVDRGNYEAFNKLLQESDLDLAFICGGPYVEGKETFNLQLLVKPETLSGETVYYSLVLVPVGSTATALADLRGKSFAFTDPKSNTGYIVPSALLARINETPGHFFSEISYTYAHDRSIRAVAEGVVDAAAVDSLIYDYLTHIEPKLTSRVRILLRSSPYGIPPVVVRPDLPPETREQLRTLLLDMGKNADGQKILNGMLLRRFVPATDADYNSIRKDRELVRQLENR